MASDEFYCFVFWYQFSKPDFWDTENTSFLLLFYWPQTHQARRSYPHREWHTSRKRSICVHTIHCIRINLTLGDKCCTINIHKEWKRNQPKLKSTGISFERNTQVISWQIDCYKTLHKQYCVQHSVRFCASRLRARQSVYSKIDGIIELRIENVPKFIRNHVEWKRHLSALRFFIIFIWFFIQIVNLNWSTKCHLWKATMKTVQQHWECINEIGHVLSSTHGSIRMIYFAAQAIINHYLWYDTQWLIYIFSYVRSYVNQVQFDLNSTLSSIGVKSSINT